MISQEEGQELVHSAPKKEELHTICRVTKFDLSSPHETFEIRPLLPTFFTMTLIRRLTDHTDYTDYTDYTSRLSHLLH